jgi:hypothetical protein|nr:MAG TPA: Short C-terminal domain [Crassvirales sp.]
MKISFGNYSYYDPTNKSVIPQGDSTNEYKFNNSLFQQLIANRQYQDAADYASKYHFDDPATQRAHENDILNLRREGRKIAAVYGRIDDNDKLNKMSFLDNVFVDGGLEQISDNPYAEQFASLKQHLGSTHKKGLVGYTDEIDNEATAISFTFAPEKQTLFGIDWLAKDNTERSVEAFYANSGLNEAALKSAGVEITHKDGSTTIKFDKSNPLANKIIYNAIPSVSGGDIGGGSDFNIVLKGYTADGKEIKDSSSISKIAWSKMRNMISDADEAKTEAFSALDMAEKDYSSTVGPSLDDNLEQLNQLLATGQITQQEYNQQRKIVGSILDQAIRSLGSGNYEMFSNAYNDESTDETLISLDNTQRSEIIQSITAANPKSLHFNAMVSNGQIGTLVTIDADEVDSNKINDEDTRNQVKRRRRQIFIPGFMSELAQEKINRNTSSRAVQEINSMQDYGYGFKTTDGREIYSSIDGRFWCDGQEISKDEATKAINKTMIIEDATNNLKYQFTNKEGTMYDTDGYENMARAIAVKAANELHPEIPFGDKVTVKDIFDKKGAGPTVADEYASKMQYQLYDKYQDVFDIYDKIMAAIINND